MDWQQRMNDALAYLEANLYGEAELDAAARAANCSTFHFCRIFQVITGIGPGEYLRRRRLSEAALALSGSKEKVIDVALRFGYDSPDAFARAFRREFGCLPSDARRESARLHSYPPLSFQIVLKGDRPMEYRIEEGKAMELAGIDIRCRSKDGSNMKDVPAFWDAICADGRFKALCAKANPASMAVCGVCRDFDFQSGEFTYSIAVDKPESMEGMPKGSEAFTVPASTWGKFTSRGPLRPNFQDTIKRVFAEWLPASDWETAGSAEIEYYSDGDGHSADYWCEYWIPLKKLAN
jgi:AraC family transcriptional regulator